MNESQFGEQHSEESERNEREKTAYFFALAMKYLPEMKQLLRGGKLTRREVEGKKLPPDSRENWSNIAEHCLTQAAIIEMLSDKLGWKPKVKFKELVRIMIEADCAKLGLKLPTHD